jgi:hypothetical protein
MKLLVALLATVGAAIAVIYVWRKRLLPGRTDWSHATDSAAAWSKSAHESASATAAAAAQTASETVDGVTATADKAAGTVSDVVVKAKDAATE